MKRALSHDSYEDSAIPPEMTGALVVSVAFHVLLAVAAVVGLPHIKRPPLVLEMPISVEVLSVSEVTRVTSPPQTRVQPDSRTVPEPPRERPPPPPRVTTPDPPRPVPVQPPVPQQEPSPAPVPAAAPEVAPLRPVTPPRPVPRPESRPAPPAAEPEPETAPAPVPDPPKAETLKEIPAKPDPKPKQDPEQVEQAFAALLRNLAPELTGEQPRPEVPQAPMAAVMSNSEIATLYRQISGCWNVAAGARFAEDLVVDVRLEMNPDRTVREIRILDQGRYNRDSFFRAAADSARRAVEHPACTPLHLPPDKYDLWKTIDIQFDPGKMLR